MQNAPWQPQQLRGLEVERIPLPEALARFDLGMHAWENSGEMGVSLIYDCSLFDAWRAEGMLAHYVRLIELVAADPAQSICGIDLLGAGQRHLILNEWSSTLLRSLPAECIHEAIERQVEKTPDRIAVVADGELLSYAELDRRSNRLAHYLRELGVQPEAAVGICSRRTLNMVVAVVAILKAGGMYVPLDPDSPPERQKEIIADAGCGVVLASASVDLGLGASSRPVLLDLDHETWTRQPSANIGIAAGVRPGNVAYMIYTSGSTGRPKGAVVGHRQALNHIWAVQESTGFPVSARYAAVHPLAVDGHVTFLFCPLLTGGCLHLISEEAAIDAARLGEYFEREPVDCLKIAPSHLAALHRAARNPAILLPRHSLLVGGEALRSAWIQSVQELQPQCAIYNHYGPTETTVGTVMHRFDRQADCGSPTVPLGRPLLNTRVYVLDRTLEPVPPGVAGELCIAGPQVARGYWGACALTAERFVADPYGAPGTRIYRTGDLVQWRTDGRLEFLGRADFQVKIRGFRVELAEIEAVLRSQPGVAEAVAVVRQRDDHSNLLVGYVVPEHSATVSTDALLRRLGELLPDHMVPSAITPIAALPRKPQGKLDRDALPAPDFSFQPESRSPRTPREILLASLFCELLGLESVGVDDDFFNLGGHSLLATQLVSRVRAAFGVDLPIRAVFEFPTILGLAEKIEGAAPSLTPTLRKRAGVALV